jgi:copper oxidase (laccase) domain-containing protein
VPTVSEEREIEMRIPGTDLELCIGDRKREWPSAAEAVFLEQVHGSDVLSAPAPGDRGDGMVFPAGGGFPGLRVADCLPVFAVWDGFTGAAHAGWRGLSQGVVENLLGSVDQPLRWLILGPCICEGCYEVGEDVRQSVAAGDPAGPAGHPPGRADLRGGALRRAAAAAGHGFRVMDISACTMESSDLYSFRRDGTHGRNTLWLAEYRPDLHIQHPYRVSIYDPPRGE